MCTALRFSQSLGLDFVMEISPMQGPIVWRRHTHCHSRTKVALHAHLYASLFSLSSSRSVSMHVFLYILWPSFLRVSVTQFVAD